jgi:hypothetical protein
MTLVAVHQPNYAPWLGYFHKLARADVFVFLDDAQFSKGSYTNRVQVLLGGKPRWLTVPVSQTLGTPINRVAIARDDWARAHLDSLHAGYRDAAQFRVVWPDIEDIYAGLPHGSLAQANAALIARLASKLGISTPTHVASALGAEAASGDDRLIALCRHFGGDVAYLSGRGGAKYQDESKFMAAGVPLHYTTFEIADYPQGGGAFVGGLSVLDAVFHLGWQGAAELVTS